MTLPAASLGAWTWPGLFSVNVEVDIRLQLQSLLQQMTDVSDALLVAIGRLLIIPLWNSSNRKNPERNFINNWSRYNVDNSYLQPDCDPVPLLPDVDDSTVNNVMVGFSVGSNQDEQRLQPEGVEIVIVLEVALPPLQNPSASVHVLEVFPVRHDAFLNRKGVLEMTYPGFLRQILKK